MGICSHFRLGTRPCTKAGFILNSRMGLGSSTRRVGPSAGLAASDSADDSSVRCFANDSIKNDESP